MPPVGGGIVTTSGCGVPELLESVETPVLSSATQNTGLDEPDAIPQWTLQVGIA